MGYAQRAARAWAGLTTVVAGLSAVAVFGFSAPAAADVSFDTEQAQRTGGARVAFKVTNDSPTASVTKFEVRFPGGVNIPEIYPIAVADWAPEITMKKVDDDPGHDIPTAVVWITMPGKEIKPGGTSLLPLAMGPMPDAEFLYLDVIVTRSDGSTETWAGVDTPTAGAQHAAFAVKLVPLAPGEVPEVGHGAAADDSDVAQTHPAAQDPAAQDPAAQDSAADDSDGAGSSNTVWLAVLLLVIAALTGFALYRQRRGGAASVSAKLAETADGTVAKGRVPAQRKKGAPSKKAPAGAKKAAPAAKKATPATRASVPAKATTAKPAPAKVAPAKPAPAKVAAVVEPAPVAPDGDRSTAVQRRSVVRATAAKKAADRRRTVTRKSVGGAATATIARQRGNGSNGAGDNA